MRRGGVMHRYPHHIGDYAAHTRHLSEIEDLAYRRMLELYYLHEHPLVGRPEDIARAIGMSRRSRETQRVLDQFFTQGPDGWHNKRADRELADYWGVVDRNRKNGKLGGRPRKQNPNGSIGTNPDGLVPLPSPLSPVPEVPPSPSVSTPQGGSKPTKRVCSQAERPDGVPEPLWRDWNVQRNKLRAPITDTVIEGFRREAAKAGISLEAAVREAIERNWRGFRADWYLRDHGATNGHVAPEGAEAWFEHLYKVYGKPDGRELAWRKWLEIGPTVDLWATTVAAARAYVAEHPEPRFRMELHRWLAEERWKDLARTEEKAL